MINTHTSFSILFGILLTLSTDLSCPRRSGRVPQPIDAPKNTFSGPSYAKVAWGKPTPPTPLAPVVEDEENDVDDNSSTASANTSVPTPLEAESDEPAASPLADPDDQTPAAIKIQSATRRFLAKNEVERIREQMVFRAEALASLPRLPMPLIAKPEETAFGYGKQAGLVDTLFHFKSNFKEAIAYQINYCNAQLAYCFANKPDEYTRWVGYYYGICDAINLANLCYAKGFYSSLPATDAITQFTTEFEAIHMGYQWDGYAYYGSKRYADGVWAEHPEHQQYKRTDSVGKAYYIVPDDQYYEWALRPDNTEMRKETLARLMVHFKQGLADRP